MQAGRCERREKVGKEERANALVRLFGGVWMLHSSKNKPGHSAGKISFKTSHGVFTSAFVS